MISDALKAYTEIEDLVLDAVLAYDFPEGRRERRRLEEIGIIVGDEESPMKILDLGGSAGPDDLLVVVTLFNERYFPLVNNTIRRHCDKQIKKIGERTGLRIVHKLVVYPEDLEVRRVHTRGVPDGVSPAAAEGTGGAVA